jgi:hypothetical protein
MSKEDTTLDGAFGVGVVITAPDPEVGVEVRVAPSVGIGGCVAVAMGIEVRVAPTVGIGGCVAVAMGIEVRVAPTVGISGRAGVAVGAELT